MPAPHHSVFLQAGCPSCHPTNSVKALKAVSNDYNKIKYDERMKDKSTDDNRGVSENCVG